jgi:hypothetical protein
MLSSCAVSLIVKSGAVCAANFVAASELVSARQGRAPAHTGRAIMLPRLSQVDIELSIEILHDFS